MKYPEINQAPKIQFRPLSEGLGFHPFSDGLPYAPLPKSARNRVPPISRLDGMSSSPQGAVAAGMPRMAPPPPRLHTPSSHIPPIQRPLVIQTQKTQKDDLGPFYLFKRVLAYLMDFFLVTILLLGIFSGLIWAQNIQTSLFAHAHFLPAVGIFLLVSHWIMVTAQEVLFKTSLGKAFFGLELNGKSNAIFFRSCFFLLSLGLSGVGLFWSLFHPLRRCWHDSICNVQPTRKPI